MSSPSPSRACDPDCPGLPPVGIVGAGRVGAVLGGALRAAGARVVGTSAVSAASLARASSLLPGVPVLPADEVAARAGLLVLAVPDDVLPGLVAGLAETGALRPGIPVLHVSGRHALDVLAPAAAAGARPLAVHPAMTFTGTDADLPRLAGAAFGVTAGAADLPFALGFVRLLGGTPVEVPPALRPLWHAGLAHGANHLVTLVASAMEVLRAAGVDDPAGALRPLLSAALDNTLAAGAAALTGPVARSDAGTVADHLDALTAYAPAERALYVSLARATAARLPTAPSPELVDVLTLAGAVR